jgi:hypothetical protein
VPGIAVVGAVAARLVRPDASAAEMRTAVDALAPALARLETDRNPFTYVVKALCCLLLTTPAPPEESPCPPSPDPSVSRSPRSPLS